MKMLCIDGNSVANRAFYGIKLLTTKDGRYTNAVYGFMNIFLRVISEQKPDAVAVAFDLPAPTFRHRQYDKYKANRKRMPEELSSQMPVLKELLSALGYREVSKEGYEADDIIGTLSEHCREAGWACVIATGDRDSLQLIGDDTSVLLTTTQFGKGETSLVDVKRVLDDYGVSPEQMIEIKALMGDASDNVPGVAGIGEKTALALIQEYGSLDGIYADIDDAGIKDSVRKKLVAGKDMAYLSKELVTICKRVPIEINPEAYQKLDGNAQKAAGILQSLEMYSLIDRLGLPKPSSAEIPSAEAPVQTVEIKALTASELERVDTVCVAFGGEGLLASVGTALFSVPGELEEKLLSENSLKKICYDLKKLCHYGLAKGYEVRGEVFDIKLAAYLLNPSSRDYSIRHIASEYDTAPLFESEDDAGIGFYEPLALSLGKLLGEADMSKLFEEIEVPLAGVLARMEREGFLVDTKGIREFGDHLTEEIEHERDAVFSYVGREFNINSPKQLGDALFIDLALPSGKKTKSGYSTNAEVLEKLRGLHPVVGHVLKFRTYGKLNSTYVEGLLKAASADTDQRIHSEFKQTETRTGRISSTNPNLQNIPVRTELGSRMRKFFIAKEGCVLLDADYSQIELRVLASVSSDEKMIDAFLHGRDIHTETASEIFKIGRERVNPELRRRAKAVNFGIVYGIGAFSLAEDVGVSMAEASDYISGYLDTYSGVKRYLDETVKEAAKNGYITTMFNRRRLLPELSSSNKTIEALGRRLAMNTPIQGAAADIIKIAMIRVRDRLKAELLEAKLILQVHDELIVECAVNDADRAKTVLKEEMEGAVKLAAPLEVSVGMGKSWYDAK